MLADNKLALNAGWDKGILADELKALLSEDFDFDIGVIGFTNPNIDGHVGNFGKTQHRACAMAAGEMSAREFTTFLSRALQNLIVRAKDNRG